MIAEAILTIRDLLNDHLRTRQPAATPESTEDAVVLIDGDSTEPINFKLGAVSLLLVNLESDATMRSANPFQRTLSDGTAVPAAPAIHLNLYILFVARYRLYEQSLRSLSAVVEYLQAHPALDRVNSPGLDEGIERLIVELVTLPFAEQAEIWGALRSAYQPSVLYRLRLIRVEDESNLAAPAVSEVEMVVTP